MIFKSGFVSIIGRPNVGKSSLLNSLIGDKMAIISNKPQTTRNTVRGILTRENYQIVFIDTPGMHKPKTKLGKYMMETAEMSVRDGDVILFMVEAFDEDIGPGDQYIIESLKNIEIPVILVINKIDFVKDKKKLLMLISKYKEKMNFKDIMLISAINKEGTDLLVEKILEYLLEGPKYFPDDIITDQPEKHIVAELIREKMLILLKDEIPHGVGIEILSFKEKPEKNIIHIMANIYCEKESHKKIIIGKKGNILKEIGTLSRKDIEKFLGTKVYLELWVKVKQDWRNNFNMLKELGYTKDK